MPNALTIADGNISNRFPLASPAIYNKIPFLECDAFRFNDVRPRVT